MDLKSETQEIGKQVDGMDARDLFQEREARGAMTAGEETFEISSLRLKANAGQLTHV